MMAEPKVAAADEKQQVTALILHLVKSGKEHNYEQWLHGISAIAQQFEGHSGVSYIRPQDSTHPEYAIILRFDCYKNLKKWLDSPIRQQWIDRVKPIIQSDESMQILTGLETWFALSGRVTRHPPKRYKMALLTTLSVFLVARLLKYLIEPALQFLPTLLRAFILTALTVLLLVYVVMPRVTRFFYQWLYPKDTKP